MFRPLWGGIADTAGVPDRRALAAGVVAAAADSLARRLRRSESSSDSNEAAGKYPVKIVTAEFPAKQRLGETTLLRLGVRNTGHKTLPALTVTISVGGKEGRNSSLPFGYRDPAPGLAQPDRPVWVLSAALPESRTAPPKRAGAETVEPQDLRLRPAEAGCDDRSGLEAERGQNRRTTSSSTKSAPASAARRRRRPRPGPKPAAPSRRRSRRPAGNGSDGQWRSR